MYKKISFGVLLLLLLVCHPFSASGDSPAPPVCSQELQNQLLTQLRKAYPDLALSMKGCSSDGQVLSLQSRFESSRGTYIKTDIDFISPTPYKMPMNLISNYMLPKYSLIKLVDYLEAMPKYYSEIHTTTTLPSGESVDGTYFRKVSALINPEDVIFHIYIGSTGNLLVSRYICLSKQKLIISKIFSGNFPSPCDIRDAEEILDVSFLALQPPIQLQFQPDDALNKQIQEEMDRR